MIGVEFVELLALAPLQRALAALLICGVGLPIVGVLIVGLDILTVRFALMHTALLGAALGLIVGVDPVFGAMLMSGLAGLAMAPMSQRPSGAAGAMGFIMVVSIALAFLLLSAAGVGAAEVMSLLWGSVLATRPQDLFLLGLVNVAALAVFWLHRRELALMFFDREIALVSGVAVARVLTVVFLAVSIGIAGVMPITGALLVDAVTLLPALAARNLGRSLGGIVALAVCFGVTGNLTGFALALLFDQPVGPVLILTAGSITLTTFLLGRPREVFL